MKILYLTDQVYLHGGAERILSLKLNHFIEVYNYDVFLITTEQKNNKPVYFLNSKIKSKDLGINYHREISYFHPKNLIKSISHFIKLKREIKRINPDVIISLSYSPDQYFLPIIEKKIPKLKEFHTSRNNYKPSFLRRTLDTIFTKYDTLILLNETEKSYYTNKNKIVIPNFTDFKPNSLKLDNREKTVIAAGRIAPVKQFDKLIEIWKGISADFPEWKLKIFGDGDSSILKKINQLIEEYNLTETAFVLPSTNNIQEEMQKASVFALTSYEECFPMVLLESQSCSLPIVSFDCPNGPRFIINNNSDGILVEKNNIEDFQKALKLLMNDEKLRINFGDKAADNVQKFSKEKVMKQWSDMIVSVSSVKN
ncbi:glycosyltransferase family 4 protein [Flavobacterium sp.]|jgi:glycosyltransferase involved in cell wall biosynthesis|uniref:glycosyltransferase family 4 protein n=1 Tax=Flavobacterium sp. TaxID=239 RepID=UPI0037BFC0DB